MFGECNMNTHVFCKKLKKKLQPLEKPPFPGCLGNDIYNNISKQAWQEWIFMQSKIINEYKLNLFNKDHRRMLVKQMKKFLNNYN